MTDDPDRADREHLALAAFPEHDRTAAACLLALPPDHVIGRDSTGTFTAALALECLRNGHITAWDVVELLVDARMVHPGIGAAQ